MEMSANRRRMGERLKSTGEVWIVDENDWFRLDFIMKMERRFRSTAPDMGAVLKRNSSLRFVYS